MNFQLSMTATKILAASLVLMPAAGVTSLLFINFFKMRWKESWVDALSRSIMVLSGVCALLLTWSHHGAERTVLDYGDWLTLPSTKFSLSFVLDSLSLTYLVTSGFIAAVVGYFSARYLHRDPGYLRFFTFYLLFVAGLDLAILAGQLLVLVVGWELVGLSSVLLVGFYHERKGPVDGSRVVFTAYRIGDIGLHGLTICLPLLIGSDQLFPKDGAMVGMGGGSLALICSLLILLAAACKAAQGPFSVWLPRAMEGPTPSSAIFYGALSVHLGAYLLLRTSHIWREVAVMPWLIVLLGGLTVHYGASVGRTRSDIKSMLAYAAMAQLGLIFVEIGLGWDRLALWHMVGHAMLRTLQFLRSPAAISDWIRFGRLQGWRAPQTAPFESRLGPQLEKSLYAKAFFGWGLDRGLHQVLVRPLLSLAAHLDRWDHALCQAIDGTLPTPNSSIPGMKLTGFEPSPEDSHTGSKAPVQGKACEK